MPKRISHRLSQTASMIYLDPMRIRLNGLFVFLLCSFSFAQQPQSVAVQKITDLRPTLLFISIDAFRADYLDSNPAPNLHKLAAAGASGSIIPVFPTLTFPNHYSIATGLYPAHHGI